MEPCNGKEVDSVCDPILWRAYAQSEGVWYDRLGLYGASAQGHCGYGETPDQSSKDAQEPPSRQVDDKASALGQRAQVENHLGTGRFLKEHLGLTRGTDVPSSFGTGPGRLRG